MILPILQNLAAANCKPPFLGFKPWYAYLPLDSDCTVKSFTVLPNNGKPSDIPLILLALVDDLLIIAGLAAVIFVIYGAVQYVTSQGNPDQASKAQSTIVNALIGLALSIVAVGIVSFFGSRIGAA